MKDAVVVERDVGAKPGPRFVASLEGFQPGPRARRPVIELDTTLGAEHKVALAPVQGEALMRIGQLDGLSAR